jgi:threonyl-tRNA synthetase
MGQASTGRDVAEGILEVARQEGRRIWRSTASWPTSPIPSPRNGRIEIVTRDDPRALELIRHDAAHVMAEAVQELWPGTQVTIGPVIDNGFYYDFHRNEPFTPDDLPAIEAKMREIMKRNKPPSPSRSGRATRPSRCLRDKGEAFKVELVDAIPEGQDLKIYNQGDWFDLCRGPHMASTGQIGDAFKLMKVAGAYWRGDSNNPMLTRIYGTAWRTTGGARQPTSHARGGGEARPPQARPRDGPLPLPGGGAGRRLLARQGLDDVPDSSSPTCAGACRHGYDEVNAPQLLDKSLWETSGHWGWYRENMFGAVGRRRDRRRARLRDQADELPGPRADLQAWPEVLSRPAAPLAEFGIVHRYEPSGALHGLMRVRGFTQDDAHVFCTEEQMAAECLRINELILSTYQATSASTNSSSSSRPGRRSASAPMRIVGSGRGVMGEVLKTIAEQSGGHQDRDQPGRGRLLRPEVRIRAP